MTPTTAQIAAALIRSFEGVRLTSYKDSGGVWTIAHGHTGPDVVAGMTCTVAQAEAWFEKDMAPLLKMVGDRSPIEGACLVSFGYNCGAGALTQLMTGKIDFMDRIRDRKGNVMPGLVSRRTVEKLLVAASKSTADSATQIPVK